jgi:hypothetical protein
VKEIETTGPGGLGHAALDLGIGRVHLAQVACARSCAQVI